MNLTRILTVVAVVVGAALALVILKPAAVEHTWKRASAALLGRDFEATTGPELLAPSPSSTGEASLAPGKGQGGEADSGSEPSAMGAAGPDGSEEEAEQDVTAELVTRAIDAMLEREAQEASRPGDKKKAQDGKGKKGEDDEEEPSAGRNPEQSKRLLQQAKEARKAGDYERALALLNESIQQDPRNGGAYRDLAGMYRTMGMQAEELQTYQDWMGAAPKDALPHYMMASAYERYGMDQEAYAELAEFQRMNAGDVSTYPMTASMYGRLGMRDQQGAVLESWASEAPGSLDAHRALGQYYRGAGDYESAVAQYQAATQLVPGNASVHAELASAYMSLREYEAARAELSVAAELNPANLGVQLRLGNVYRLEGDPYSARAVYESVIEAQPNSPEAVRASREINRIDRQLAASNTGKKP